MSNKFSLITVLLPVFLLWQMPGRCFADAVSLLEQAQSYKNSGNHQLAEQAYNTVAATYPGTDHALTAKSEVTIMSISAKTDSQIQAEVDSLKAEFSALPQLPAVLCNIAAGYAWAGRYQQGGGAVYAKTTGSGHCHTILTNCILWGNTAANNGHEVCCDGDDYNSIAKVTLNYCDIQDTTDWMFEENAYSEVDYLNNYNRYDNPTFVSIASPKGGDNEWATGDDGFMIQNTSDCIGNGDDVTGWAWQDYNITEDITGNDRKIGSDVDIGAYEYDPD